jgi:toxin-antitoxin system PIN domain toxin
MTSFFPDLNVWLALSVSSHQHSGRAWQWVQSLSQEPRLMFCRYTQVVLLRLLTNSSVMGEQILTLSKAWNVYDRWLEDPRVEFHPEPRGLDLVFRRTTASFASQPASKWVGDCYLLAYALHTQAALVTFDTALHALAHKEGHRALMPV